jgi:hydroxymethylbilane synthase
VRVRLVLATRGSPLALAQAALVEHALRERGHRVERLPLVTTGDRRSAAAGTPPQGAKGLFVKELEEALLDGRADLAVHSAKDLPAELPAGLAIGAVPPRADPRDVLIGPPGGLDALPPGARVATGSPRRRAQLLAVRPDLEMVEMRGNVDTRLRRLAEGRADAIVLAAAGLARLGLAPPGTEPLDPEISVPAPGQGALALEVRTDRAEVLELLASLDDPASRDCLLAERAALAGLGGDCLAPVGAFAAPVGDGRLRLDAFVAAPDGSGAARLRLHGDRSDPEGLGARAALGLGLAAAQR